MKRILLALSFVLLFTLAACAQTTDDSIQTDETYVTLDMNPAVSFIIDEDDNVVLVNALNEDGEMLLFNLDLVGENIETAIDRLIGEAGDLGFIDPDAAETVVEIEVIGRDIALENRVRARFEEALEKAFEDRDMPVQVRDRVYDQAFIQEAQQRGLEAREYRLIQQALMADPELSEEEARNLDTDELVALVREHGQNISEHAQALRESFLTAKQEVFDYYNPQIEDLENQIEAAIEADEPVEDLEAELDALEAEKHAALMDVVDDFTTQAQAIRNEMITEFHQRKEDFKDRFPQ